MSPEGFELPIKVLFGGRGYEVTKTVSYFSPRYKKRVTAPEGMVYDGATGVPDLMSVGSLYHDVLCLRMTWDDASPVTNWQASMVLHDIMRKEGRKGRSIVWKWGTVVFRPASNWFEKTFLFWRKPRKPKVYFPPGWTLGTPQIG
jgi:hypothetical protein